MHYPVKLLEDASFRTAFHQPQVVFFLFLYSSSIKILANMPAV